MERTIIKTTEALKEYLKTFNNQVFAIDTETTSLSYYNQQVTHIQIANNTQVCVIILTPQIINIIKDWIDSLKKETIIIGHNIVFDAKALYKIGINILSFTWFDTMIAQHLIDETDNLGLKYLANKYIGVETTKYEEAKENEEKFLEYSMNDATWTYELFKILAPKLKEQELEFLMKKIEMPFLRVIWMMETTGFMMDKIKIETITKEIKEELFEIEKNMYTLLKEPYEIQYKLDGTLEVKGKLNFDSGDQIGKILFDKLGLQEQGTTNTGKRKTGKNTIKSLKGQHEFVNLLEKYKIARKLLSSFFEPMPNYIDEDNRVRSSFNDCGTKTGRLSCSNPNLQQLPKKNDIFPVETRSCFIAPQGKKLIASDYSGQELRVLAHLTGDEGLIDAFNNGKDFHQETADKFGVSRAQSKAINFGVAYGKSSIGFAKDWKCSPEQAQEFLDKYFKSFPKVKQSIEDTTKEVKRNGYVTSMTGRRRRFSKIKEGNNEFYKRSMFREAFNFKIQGFSADMMRVACIKILNLCSKNKDWDMKIITIVHDEVVVEVKDEYVEEAMKAINYAMVTAVKLKVPLLSDTKNGNNYAEVK